MTTSSSLSTSGASLRHHPELHELFKLAESRQLTEQELEAYYRAIPEHVARATAAREIAAVERSVVQNVIDEIFALYPYEQQHQAASSKCSRDVRYVSAYATLAMLMNDPQWFDDKLLIWMKTILQAFEFPERGQQRKALFSVQSSLPATTDKLKPHQLSIYETYTRLKQHYQRTLTSTSYTLIEPYLQQAIDVLAHD